MNPKIFRPLLAILLLAGVNKLAYSQVDSTVKNFITSFRQDSAGNCASISVIKLSLYHFGFDKIFKSIDSTQSDKYTIILQDDKKVTISKEEIAQVSKLAFLNL